MTRTARPRLIHGLVQTLFLPAHLLERTRGRRRFVLVLGYVLIAVPLLVLAWRELRLMEVPKVGEPFDTRAFAARDVPDDRNAYVLYRQAQAKSRQLVLPPPTQGAPPRAVNLGSPGTPPDQWAPEVHRWLDDNRESLDLWLAATRRPDALDIKPADLRLDSRMEVLQQLRDFARLAQLEASRLESEGDMAGAYRMYQGMLRSSRHASLNGTLIGRLVGTAIHGMAAAGIENWADDPRTDATLLRLALKDAVDHEKTRVPNSFAFQHEYFLAMNAINDPSAMDKLGDELMPLAQGPNDGFPINMKLKCWLMREPERSRRLYRLWFANWLAYCDLPRDQRPAKTGNRGIVQFQPGPNAPPGAHVLSPEEMERQLDKAPLARLLLPAVGHVLSAMDRETIRHGGLVIALAERLHLVERGQPPRVLGDLLGTYLDELPEEYAPTDPPLTGAAAPTSDP